MLFMLVMLSLWYHFTYVHPMLNGCNDNKKNQMLEYYFSKIKVRYSSFRH